MQTHEELFSAEVALPCKIFCGPDSLIELVGTAVNIGPAGVRLHLFPLDGGRQPLVGELVHLELLLSEEGVRAKARYLSVRARVAEAAELPDGWRRLELRFRKPVFKERLKETGAKSLQQSNITQSAHAKWRM